MTELPRTQNPAVARIIEKQMRNWEISRSQHPDISAPRAGEVSHFVTIANAVGAGGNEVAGMLAEELGWPLFDREILTAMAGDDEVRARLYRTMDERDLGWFENFFCTLTQEVFREDDYFHRLTEAVLVITRQGPAVFVGRSADLILPRNRGLRIKVIASPEFCVERFIKHSNVSAHKARKEIARIEHERSSFVRNHFHIDPYEPTRFDMLINVERFTTRQVVDTILGALRMRMAGA